MRLNNKTYDILKWIVLIFLPALVTFISTIGQSFNVEWLLPVVTIMSAFTTFLGTIIGVSTVKYNGDNNGN